jgi:hypothetical protein
LNRGFGWESFDDFVEDWGWWALVVVGAVVLGAIALWMR